MSWLLRPLGQVTEKIGSGATPRGGDSVYKQAGVPLVRSMNVHDGFFDSEGLAFIDSDQAHSLRNATLQKGDVLINITGASVARSCLLPDDLSSGRVNQHVAIIRPNRELDARFLSYFLTAETTKRKLLNTAGTGATREALTKSQLEALKVPLPPLDEQKRIAAILDKAYGLLSKRHKAITLLDSLTQSIFLEMFGDPASNPMGWDICRIGDLVESASYGSSGKAGQVGRYRILRMGNLTVDGRIDTSDLKYIDLTDDEAPKYTVRRGDLLFNRTNSADLVGKTAVFDLEGEFAFAGYLVRARTNDQATPEYIATYLNSIYGKALLRGMAKSIVGMANINAKEMKNISIPVPPKALQEHFSAKLRGLTKMRLRVLPSAALAESLFASLQHRAFSGQL